mmetsp:Transcript_35502/g.66928  ORF Transcript_35502/g.66928 Transcript_35502/m.66928 type:complete len:523 (+) Transcript_35502:75-1643(+)
MFVSRSSLRVRLPRAAVHCLARVRWPVASAYTTRFDSTSHIQSSPPLRIPATPRTRVSVVSPAMAKDGGTQELNATKRTPRRWPKQPAPIPSTDSKPEAAVKPKGTAKRARATKNKGLSESNSPVPDALNEAENNTLANTAASSKDDEPIDTTTNIPFLKNEEDAGTNKGKRKAGTVDAETEAKAIKKSKAVEKCVLARTPTPAKPPPPGIRFLAISYNINSLRSAVTKCPEVLTNIMKTHQPDVLCLQEHKLQEKDVPGMENTLREMFPQYKCHWTCSVTKKGYSGVVALTKESGAAKGASQSTMVAFLEKAKPEKSQAAKISGSGPLKVTFGLGKKDHDDEGRMITLEYPTFYLVLAYVPNAGDGLKRLDYRIKSWETDLATYLKTLESVKPVVYGGDLNVAHLDRDIWNVDAKHISKSAGTTPEERKAFGNLIANSFVDTFRHFHPDAENCYTYWSVRAGNKQWNRGLRLDYFLASETLISNNLERGLYVHDAWIMDDIVPGGDHCPVAVVLNLGGSSA